MLEAVGKPMSAGFEKPRLQGHPLLLNDPISHSSEGLFKENFRTSLTLYKVGVLLESFYISLKDLSLLFCDKIHVAHNYLVFNESFKSFGL
jgi:hypothetical protein